MKLPEQRINHHIKRSLHD